jgi:hypothetical protein
MRRFRIARRTLGISLALGMISATALGQSKGLARVAAITTSDVWAVGNSTSGLTSSTLAEHWDGTAWTIVSTPNPQGACSQFNAVAAVSSTDVWAVGSPYGVGICPNKTHPGFIEHWDGSSWSIVPSPSPAYRGFTGVAVIASNDVWAVGYNQASLGFTTTLTEHWDGSAWTVVPSPSAPVQQTSFSAVTAVSTNDVWAVGAYLRPVTNLQAPFVEHWDGTSWQIVEISPPPAASFLFSAANMGSADVWTTGDTDLVYQWNGSEWTRSPVKITNGNLGGIAVFPGGLAWAVGFQGKLEGNSATLTEHWDGSQWTFVDSPNVANSNDGFGGVSGTSDTDVWAVGGYTVGLVTSTLIEHWDGIAWSIVPSP